MSKFKHQKDVSDRFLGSVITVTLTTGIVGIAIAPNVANAESLSVSTVKTTNNNVVIKESELIRSASTDPLSNRRISQNVTSVSQLSDVRSTDWAFTALQSLVERYGVIAHFEVGNPSLVTNLQQV
jgi:hypothetical protein